MSDAGTGGPRDRWPGFDSEITGIGFVLAGGQSSRMGTDKALIDFAGRPLLEHAIGTLKAAGLSVLIAGSQAEARPRLESYAPVISDTAPGLGPLAGVCAGLRSTSAPQAVFLPVDMPLMPSSLIQYLLWHACVTRSVFALASVNAFAQTFPAVIAREALPELDRRLHEGEAGCLAAFRASADQLGQMISVLPVEVLLQSGQVSHPQALPAVHWFSNVNSPPDLARLGGLRHLA